VVADHEPKRDDDAALARRNRRRGRAIAAGPGLVLGLVVLAIGFAVAGPVAAVGAGLVVLVALWLAIWFGATATLVRALRATEADEDEQARVFNQVEGLCATMGLAIPRICVVDDDAHGAMVVGRRRRLAVLVVTAGLADVLDPVQLEAVLAHELVHIKNADIVPATMAACVVMPLAPFVPRAPNLVHLLAGRGREFRADQRAVRVTRYPPGLRQALALMVDGPAPLSTPPLAGRTVAEVTRWLWTIPTAAAGGRGAPRTVTGELDDPLVRIAALDEW
jgi:Zn-dependent protease with chaperone function